MHQEGSRWTECCQARAAEQTAGHLIRQAAAGVYIPMRKDICCLIQQKQTNCLHSYKKVVQTAETQHLKKLTSQEHKTHLIRM